MTINLVISYFWNNQNQIHTRLNQRSGPAKTIIVQL